MLGVGANSMHFFPRFSAGGVSGHALFFFRNDQHSPFTRPFGVFWTRKKIKENRARRMRCGGAGGREKYSELAWFVNSFSTFFHTPHTHTLRRAVRAIACVFLLSNLPFGGRHGEKKEEKTRASAVLRMRVRQTSLRRLRRVTGGQRHCRIFLNFRN